MTRRRAAILVLSSLTALLAAPAASAHFSLQPGEVPARSFAQVQLQVPNEKPEARTVRVAIEIPDSIRFVRVPETPGWRARVTREPLDQPLLVGDRVVERRVARIEWRGGEIAGADSQSFALRIAVPRGAGETLAFRGTQTYSDGDVVRWIGPPGSPNPAPLLVVAPFDPSAESLEIRRAPLPPPPPPPPPATTEAAPEPAEEQDEDLEAAPAPASDDDGGSLALLLVLGGAAVLAAAGLLLAARGRRRNP